MPSGQGVIETLATPPLASLQQVLDTNGPFGGGDHVIPSFTTSGAFLLPAGTYPVAGTYGVLLKATTIPIRAGRQIGFNGIVGGQDVSMDKFFDPIAQVVMISSLPITSAKIPTDVFEVQFATQLFLWDARFATFEAIGLHVFPNFSFDLFWMCVL